MLYEYILIIMMFSTTEQAPLPVTMQEFGNKTACENAIKEMKFMRENIKPLKSRMDFLPNCVPKTL